MPLSQPQVHVALALLASVAGGCRREAAPAEDMALATRELSFGDITQLGPHRLDAAIARALIFDGKRTEEGEEQLQLVWSSWDDFQFARRREGVVVSQVQVAGGVARALGADGALHPVLDVEPYRVELRMAWDVWGIGLGVFQRAMRFERLAEGDLEGRATTQYGVSLDPEAQLGSGRTVPLDLSGTVWIDDETRVRLLGEVTGHWHPHGNPQLVHEVKLALARSDFGLAGPAGAAP